MNDLSEKYQKYLTQINYNFENYYTIVGVDLSKDDDDDDDKILALNNKILLFLTFDSLKKFCIENQKSIYLFDNENLLLWINELKDYKPYVTYNFDAFKKNEEPKAIINTPKTALEILNLINFFRDIYYQFNVFEELVFDDSINLFWDFVYDEYVFTPKKKERMEEKSLPFNHALLHQSIQKLIAKFESIIVIVKDE